jgi:hypothetical protein
MTMRVMPFIRWALTLFLIASGADFARASSCFDDKNLAQLTPSQASQRPVLIYVWSPRMVYSLHNMAIASRAAAIQGMDFVVLHDGRVSPAELQQLPLPSGHGDQHTALNTVLDPAPQDLATPPFISPAQDSQALCAPALLAREALRHFPTAFVLTAQGIHAQPIVGAMPPSAWQLSLTERLKR